MATERATYSHGHHESVVKTHARRTAQDSAAFLLPHIKRTDKILDLGCGPGSITIDLALLVPDGEVIGGDQVAAVVQQAQALAKERQVHNVSFQQMDGNQLPFSDGTFDIVYCHQTLQHVGNPSHLLKEMRRVTKEGGLVAARDADYKAFAWFPEHAGLDRWLSLYQKIAKANGAEPNAGRYLPAWAKMCSSLGAFGITRTRLGKRLARLGWIVRFTRVMPRVRSSMVWRLMRRFKRYHRRGMSGVRPTTGLLSFLVARYCVVYDDIMSSHTYLLYCYGFPASHENLTIVLTETLWTR
jgi:ubiquinone/menaquinone biosynthesis C-methylase UbiE